MRDLEEKTPQCLATEHRRIQQYLRDRHAHPRARGCLAPKELCGASSSAGPQRSLQRSLTDNRPCCRSCRKCLVPQARLTPEDFAGNKLTIESWAAFKEARPKPRPRYLRPYLLALLLSLHMCLNIIIVSVSVPWAPSACAIRAACRPWRAQSLAHRRLLLGRRA